MKPWLRHGLVLGVIGLFSISPILLALLAGTFAQANDCRLDEGSVHPCVVGQRDYGALLYSLGVMGWFGLLTLPGGMLAAGIYLMVVLIRRSSARPSK